MQFAAEMIRQSPIIVMNTEVCRANFANPEFLLLIRGRRHRIAVFQFGGNLLFADILDFVHEFHGFLDFSLGSRFLGLGQFLADVFGKLVDFLGFRTDFGGQLLLGLGEPFLGEFCAPVTVLDKGI